MINNNTYKKNINAYFEILRNEIVSSKSRMVDLSKLQKKINLEIKSSISQIEQKQSNFFIKIISKNKIEALSKNIELKKIEADKILNQAKSLQNKVNYMVKLTNNISKLAKFYLLNPQGLSKEFNQSTVKFINHIEYMKINYEKMTLANKLKIGEDYLLSGKNWIILLKNKKIEIKRIEKATTSNINNRVYLPIPINMKSHAEKLGASYDSSVKYGSRMFFDLDNHPDFNDYNIQKLLPLAFKNEGENLSFPPIRYGASKQNLWSFFSKDTWDFIRSNKYLSSGNRCVICGQQGGKLVDRNIFNTPKTHAVEAHEVWDWQVPDPSSGIGIQKLKEILVVCIDCHMMFHSDYAVEQAKLSGQEDKVKKFLESKMALINRCNHEELLNQLEQEKLEAQAHNGVTTWIIDLSQLSQQEYMRNNIPVFIEDNPASVKSEHIAGITFENEDGVLNIARDASEIYDEIIFNNTSSFTR